MRLVQKAKKDDGYKFNFIFWAIVNVTQSYVNEVFSERKCYQILTTDVKYESNPNF